MNRNKIENSYIMAGVLMALSLTACGSDNTASNSAELKEFRTKVDTFCTSIATVDTNINSIDTNSEGYEQTLLSELDKLDASFKEFAAIDFPSDYDYLEGLADEAADYMDTAVVSYHDVFENDYNEADLDSKYNYATENYSRAYKRIQIIVTFLNGEISEDVTISN